VSQCQTLGVKATDVESAATCRNLLRHSHVTYSHVTVGHVVIRLAQKQVHERADITTRGLAAVVGCDNLVKLFTILAAIAAK